MLDPDAAQSLHSLTCYFEDAASIVTTLDSAKAFAYGYKHEEKPKLKKRENKQRAIKEPENVLKLPHIDFERSKELCREYNLARSRAIERIQENMHLFSNASLPDNEISNRFKAQNTGCLSLSDPTFIYKIEAEYDIATENNK